MQFIQTLASSILTFYYAAQGGNAPKYHIKCPENRCDWKGRKSRFEDHMVKRHGMTPAQAKAKMRAILNQLMSKYEQGWNFGDSDGEGEHNTSGEFFEYYGKLYPKPNHGPGSAKYIR